MANDVDDLLARGKALADKRSIWESHWQELAEVFSPRRADFTTEQIPGGKRTEHQFDGVPMQAAWRLAAALDGMLKPEAQRWFNIRAADDDLNERDDVKAWLEQAEDRLHAAIYSPGARFQQRSNEVDQDIAVFGTGVLFIGENRDARSLLFRSVHLRNAYIAKNANGDVDTIFLRERLTARQAAQRWGQESLGEKTAEALRNGDVDQEFEFRQVVLPRLDRDPRRRDNRNLPFASVTIDVASEHKVAESGFHEFPFAVPMWDTMTGEDYGRSPAMLALPDAKTLNQQGKTLLKAGHKAVDPPLLVADDSSIGTPRTWPGGVTSFDADLARQLGGRPPIIPLHTGANIPLGREMQNDTREQVWSAFLRNVLNLPVDGPQMTATEVIERREELLRVAGPVFARLGADYPAVVVERCFNIMLRADRFPAPPPVLRGGDILFKYQSPMQRVQKEIEAAVIRKSFDDIAPIVSVNPAVVDNIDEDKAVRAILESNGVPQSLLRTNDQVSRMRERREESAAPSIGTAAELLNEAAGAAPGAGIGL